MSNEKKYGGRHAWELFLVFLVLKLTGVIGWSWWWVTAPLWATLGIAAVCALAGMVARRMVDGR